MAFDWASDLSHIVTNFYFASYTVGGTTAVNDLMQAYLMKTDDRTVTGHCFRTGFTTLVDKTGPQNSWALGLATPEIIYMVHRGKETTTANTGQLEVNLYRVSDVVAEGGAYSAGATDLTGVVAHVPYATATIAQVSGYTTTAKKFDIIPWRADALLILDTVDGVQAQWRIHEVSLVDGTVTTHSSIFAAGSWTLATPNHYTFSYILKNGNLLVQGDGTYQVVDTTTWSVVESTTTTGTDQHFTELDTGDFFRHDFPNPNISCGLSASNFSSYGTYSDTFPAVSMSRIYGTNTLVGQVRQTSGSGDISQASRFTLGTYPAYTKTTFPAYSTSNENYGWGCIVSDDYWMYYNPLTREFSLVSLTDGSAHPSVSNWKEVDSDIPTGGTSGDAGNWGAIVSGAAAPSGSTAWPRIQPFGDHITLQYGIQNDDFVETYPVTVIGVADNDGVPHPLLRATQLVVSDTSANSPIMELGGVRVPTVDNIVAGSGISVSIAGSNVTIGTSGGGGGGLGDNNTWTGTNTWNGACTFNVDLSVSTDGSSTASPRIIGFTNLSSGEAARLQFGDQYNAFQLGFNSRTIIYGYWGIEIRGGRQSLTVPSFTAGAATDPSLSVIGTVAARPVLRVTGASGQSGSLQEWTNSSNTVLASMNSSGGLLIPAIDITGTGDSGTATITSGTASIAVTASVVATDAVIVSYQSADNGGGALWAVMGSGSFTIKSTSNVSANTSVNWRVIH